MPAYNAADVLPLCVTALQNQTIAPAEIIVVDDGSTDDTPAIARRLGARVLTQPHQGPAAARNLGIQNARGEIILLTDADCEPFPDWIERQCAPLSEPQVMGSKGTYQTRQRNLMARLVQLEYEYRYARMRQFSSIDFIDSYAAAYRRTTLLQFGGFDPLFPSATAEDIDLCFRLARAGCLLVFAPQAQVWHRHPTSLWVYLRRKFFYGFWRALVYQRYPEKTRGDAHTDPALKRQFVLVALTGILGLIGFIWMPAWTIALSALGVLLWTMFPFAHWAWQRDKVVALAWLPVNVLRVTVQGCALALGLVYHRLVHPNEKIQRATR